MDEEHLGVLLITANVGSIFEEPEQMFKPWLKEFFSLIEQLEPCFVALHCQEVGGKNYEASMQHVNQFVKIILASEQLVRYDRARVFLDEDYTAVDKFTALGNMYFIHDAVQDVHIFDFVENKFVSVEGREVLSGNIENIQIKEKAKFPQHFFPEFKWSRKGFLRTRWNLNNCIFDLVNIHLFHDASNIIAMESSPSIYNGNRQQALLHTLKRFESDQFDKVPMFMFGDFNFRLDTNLLIKVLTAKATSEQTLGKKDQISKIVYTEEDKKKLVLTVEAKSFDYHDKHEDLFFKTNKWLQQYDTEIQPFQDRLFEYDVNFPPSYPFSEDVNDGTSYMKTRCPSWCDRILLAHSAKDIIYQDEKYHRPHYDLIGKEVCMGDHKPVYLALHLKPGKGNLSPSRSPFSKSLRKRVLSINGEQFEDTDIMGINIHDYAVFEKENDLLPEFRSTIRSRTESGSLLAEEAKPPVQPSGRRKSFQEVAIQIRTYQRILREWPRNRSRHHSSSSEDFCEGDDDDDDSVDDDFVPKSLDHDHDVKSNSSNNSSKKKNPNIQSNSDNMVDKKPAIQSKFTNVGENKNDVHSVSTDIEEKDPVISYSNDIDQISIDLDKSVQSQAIPDPSASRSAPPPESSSLHAHPLGVSEHARPASSSPSQSGGSSCSTSPTHERSALVGKPKGKEESQSCCPCVLL